MNVVIVKYWMRSNKISIFGLEFKSEDNLLNQEEGSTPPSRLWASSEMHLKASVSMFIFWSTYQWQLDIMNIWILQTGSNPHRKSSTNWTQPVEVLDATLLFGENNLENTKVKCSIWESADMPHQNNSPFMVVGRKSKLISGTVHYSDPQPFVFWHWLLYPGSVTQHWGSLGVDPNGK